MEKIQIILSNCAFFIVEKGLIPIVTAMITTILTMRYTEKRNRIKTLPMMVVCKIGSEKMLNLRKCQLPQQDMYIILKYDTGESGELARRSAPKYELLRELKYEEVYSLLQTASFVVLSIEDITGKEITLSRLIDDIGQGQDLDSEQVPLFANGKGGYCLVFAEQDLPQEITGYIGETPITYSTKMCESGKIRAVVKGTQKRIFRSMIDHRNSARRSQ